MNDGFAYFCGMTFGKTPLIKLSPNKTLEGFLGGALFTQIFLIWFTNTYFKNSEYICMNYELIYLPCKPMKCHQTPFYVFETVYEIYGLRISRAFIACIIYGIFASLVAPFAGFLASGMKRAYQIKDFAQTLPGHGGFIDRFDCVLFAICF